jgi:hypothetical protein
MSFRLWTVPLYRPSRDKVKEAARQLLIALTDLLKRTGVEGRELEKRIDTLRRESIGGLSYRILLLEEELGIEKEEKVVRIKKSRPKKEKKRSKITRGGFF